MKRTPILILTCMLFTVSACGPSQDEVEQRMLMLKDSIENARQQQDTVILKEKLAKDSAKKIDSLHQISLTYRLAKLNAIYNEESIKLEKAKHHKLLRSKHKKEEQIEKQTEVVAHLKQQITALKKEIEK